MPEQKPQVLPPKPKYNFDTTYTFRLRRHAGDNFSGLWELAVLDAKGQVLKLVSDADGLTYCLENLQGILEDAGF